MKKKKVVKSRRTRLKYAEMSSACMSDASNFRMEITLVPRENGRLRPDKAAVVEMHVMDYRNMVKAVQKAGRDRANAMRHQASWLEDRVTLFPVEEE